MKSDVETPCSRSHSGDVIFALQRMGGWPDGVAALAETEVFEELQLLDQYHYDLRKLLGNITQYNAGKPESVNNRVDL
jgi:hypothetical protein